MNATPQTIWTILAIAAVSVLPAPAQFPAQSSAGAVAHNILMSASYPGLPVPPSAAMPAPRETLVRASAVEESSSLPDAPVPPSEPLAGEDAWTLPAPPPALQPCPKDPAANPAGQPCVIVNPYRRFLDSTTPVPLTVGQKGFLAVHNLLEPGNLITIAGTSAFTVGTNSHTAYGPGFKGFARNMKYSFAQDSTGEFFGTFLVPSIFHEDPHYHREPGRPIPHRLLHAISRTVMAQNDHGGNMPNYAVLLTYPITNEIANLYVPGVAGNGPSTVKRIATGLASDPVNNIITEFLPDVAKRINIRVIFVQRIVNMMTAGSASGTNGTAMDGGGI